MRIGNVGRSFIFLSASIVIAALSVFIVMSVQSAQAKSAPPDPSGGGRQVFTTQSADGETIYAWEVNARIANDIEARTAIRYLGTCSIDQMTTMSDASFTDGDFRVKTYEVGIAEQFRK